MTDKKVPIDNSAQGKACSCDTADDTKGCNGPDAPASESRRGFVKNVSSLSVASLMGTAALLTNSDDVQANTSWAEWFQGNYRLMTDEEKAQAIARLERRYSSEYGKEVTVDGTPAQEGKSVV